MEQFWELFPKTINKTDIAVWVGAGAGVLSLVLSMLFTLFMRDSTSSKIPKKPWELPDFRSVTATMLLLVGVTTLVVAVAMMVGCCYLLTCTQIVVKESVGWTVFGMIALAITMIIFSLVCRYADI